MSFLHYALWRGYIQPHVNAHEPSQCSWHHACYNSNWRASIEALRARVCTLFSGHKQIKPRNVICASTPVYSLWVTSLFLSLPLTEGLLLGLNRYREISRALARIYITVQFKLKASFRIFNTARLVLAGSGKSGSDKSTGPCQG